MDKENTVFFKSKKFAVRIVNLYKYLYEEKHEYVMSKQLLRCGTSIGANLAEGESGQSKKDFLAKVYIALKECNETRYWLELLFDTDYLTQTEFESIDSDSTEIKKMLTATTKTVTHQLNTKPSTLNSQH